jgi:hypothetical protein
MSPTLSRRQEFKRLPAFLKRNPEGVFAHLGTMRPRAKHAPEARVRIAAATRAAMAHPDVSGMARASEIAPGPQLLRNPWSIAGADVRARSFLELASSFGGPKGDG